MSNWLLCICNQFRLESTRTIDANTQCNGFGAKGGWAHNASLWCQHHTTVHPRYPRYLVLKLCVCATIQQKFHHLRKPTAGGECKQCITVLCAKKRAHADNVLLQVRAQTQHHTAHSTQTHTIAHSSPYRTLSTCSLFAPHFSKRSTMSQCPALAASITAVSPYCMQGMHDIYYA